MDYVFLIFQAVICSLAYLVAKKLRTTQLAVLGQLQLMQKRIITTDLSIQRVEELLDLDKQIAANRKKLENPTTDLREFLQDLHESGCGITIVHPDSVFIRGLRK